MPGFSDFSAPTPGPAVKFGGGYDNSLPLVGLAGLGQGFTQGLQLAQQWGHQANEEDIQKQNLARQAEMAKSAEAFRQAQIKHMGTQEEHATTMEGIAQQLADQRAKNYAPAGSPIQLPDGTIAAADGHGGWKLPNQGKGSAAQAKKNDGLSQLDDLSSQWDQLSKGTSFTPGPASAILGPDAGKVVGATERGLELKAQSLFPSTTAHQFEANRQLLAGKVDHDLLGRVNDVTIENAKKSIFDVFDTPESKAKKLNTLRKIYSDAPTPPAGYTLHQNLKTGEHAYINAAGDIWKP